MTEETEPPAETSLFPKTVGERLRDARLAQRLDLAEIAQRTRIPVRHLQAIEDGNYEAMPSPTYAVGFAKAYARVVGADEVEVARDVRGRAEVSAIRRTDYQPYEADEPPRTPSSAVMLGTAVLAILLIVAAGIWYGTDWFRGDGRPAAAPADSSAYTPEVVAAAPAATAAGQVTLVATDEVWLRVYDAGGTTLLQRTLAPGERYDVPADANNPMINVGRPDQLQVLLNGSAVAPLGDGRVAIKDVPIGAAALQARLAGAPPAAAPTASPSPPSSSPSPSPRSSVPTAFRSPGASATTRAAPASTGQREAPPAAATPGVGPDNATGAP